VRGFYSSRLWFGANGRRPPGNRRTPCVATSAPPAATPVLDHFKNKDRECHSCGAEWVAHEEKETDVSIGITILNDAYKGRYEKAYLVTRDSDLVHRFLGTDHLRWIHVIHDDLYPGL
jgi:hypothetical protein